MPTLKTELKWSVWSATPDEWKPEVLAALKAAWEGTDDLTVHIASRKEIRYATVAFRGHEVVVYMEEIWDGVADLVPDLIPEEAEDTIDKVIEYVEQYTAYSEHGHIGASVDQNYERGAMPFEQWLEEVDKQEDTLLVTARENSRAFERFVVDTAIALRR